MRKIFFGIALALFADVSYSVTASNPKVDDEVMKKAIRESERREEDLNEIEQQIMFHKNEYLTAQKKKDLIFKKEKEDSIQLIKYLMRKYKIRTVELIDANRY